MKKLFIVLLVIVGVIGTGYFWLTSPTETAKSIIRTRFADPSQISFKSSDVLWSGKDESGDRITNGFPAFVVRVDFEQPNGIGNGGFITSCYLVSFADDSKHGQSIMKLNEYGSFNPCDSEWLKDHNLTEAQALQNEKNRFANKNLGQGTNIEPTQAVAPTPSSTQSVPASASQPVVNPVQTIIKTPMGELTVVENNGGKLMLNGRIIFDVEMQHISIDKTFDFPGRTVVFFTTSFDQSVGVPSCYFMTLQQGGGTSVTSPMNCDGDKSFSVNQEEIIFTLSNKRRGDLTRKFVNGTLTNMTWDANLKRIGGDPEAMKHADRLAIIKGSPIKIRGSLELDHSNTLLTSGEWYLKLPKKTLISGNGDCNLGLRDYLFVEVTPPNVQGESEFNVTFNCNEGNGSITAISLSK